jgi:Asp/Glu/hydantoin racemase
MTLLVYGSGIPRTRIDTTGTLPKTIYNLHMQLKGADAHDRMEAVLVAWKSATGLQIQRRTRPMLSLVLESTPQAESLLKKPSHGGMAYYDSKASVLHCVNTPMSELSTAIETALKTPVIDEIGLAGSLLLTLPIM